MKRLLVALAVTMALTVAFGGTSIALAQGNEDAVPGARCPMGGGGGTGVLHDEMVAALASRLGLSAEDLQARLDNGETVPQIAQAQGLSAEQTTTLMRDAMQDALEAAVASGDITQEQADRMSQMGRFMGGAAGLMGRGSGMGRGMGRGWGRVLRTV